MGQHLITLVNVCFSQEDMQLGKMFNVGPTRADSIFPRPYRLIVWVRAVEFSCLAAHFPRMHPEEGQGQKSQGPSPARFWKSGDLEIQNFELQEMKKVDILKIQIRSAQNVGKVWISR